MIYKSTDKNYINTVDHFNFLDNSFKYFENPITPAVKPNFLPINILL